MNAPKMRALKLASSHSSIRKEAKFVAIDTTFYQLTHQVSSSELPDIADLRAFNDCVCDITHVAMPSEAQAGAVVLIGSAGYLAALNASRDFTIITTQELASSCPEEAAIFIAANPRIAFAQLLAHLYQTQAVPAIAATAQIAPDAKIGKDVSIGDYAIIQQGAVIADGCVIESHSIIGAHCQIGANSHIGQHVSVSFAHIGAGVTIHANTVIGKAGFGFEMTDKGAVMMPHLGLVTIGDNVTIGSLCTIDKGVLGPTAIADNVMIDNHCHIAHNVQIGANSILLAQVGIAGSSVIGKQVILAGKVGVKDHVTIADNVIVLSAARVVTNIEEAGTYGGYPAVPAKQHWREQVALRRLAAKKGKK